MALAPFEDPRARAALAPLPAAERDRALRLLDREGLWSGRAAVRRILAGLPAGRVALVLGLDRLYPWVSRRRGRLGRFVPERPLVRR